MTPEEIRKLMELDKTLKVGTKVLVHWGYGLGFSAAGRGTIVKVSEKSVQVKLDMPVKSPSTFGGEGWPEGFVLKGIPRFSLFSNKWDRWRNSVTPVEEQDGVQPDTQSV